MAGPNGAEELYEDGWCIFHIFRKMDGCFMVLKYTETGNVLETIIKKGFKGSFRIRGHCADK